MTEAAPAAITPRGLELGGSAPDDFDPVAMARATLRTARIAALAIQPATSTPQAFGQQIASEIKFWSQVAHAKNIYAD